MSVLRKSSVCANKPLPSRPLPTPSTAARSGTTAPRKSGSSRVLTVAQAKAWLSCIRMTSAIGKSAAVGAVLIAAPCRTTSTFRTPGNASSPAGISAREMFHVKHFKETTMGIDIYARWEGQNEEEQKAQYTGFDINSGHVGYLREAYHGKPYATRYLLQESFATGEANIPAATLRERLPATIMIATYRNHLLYEGEGTKGMGLIDVLATLLQGVRDAH